MGTRADFYVRQDNQMKWLGSTDRDGYPDGIEKKILKSTTAKEFEAETEAFLKTKDDATFPTEGWPWPWNDSRTPDYSYIFENGKVMASIGYTLFDPLEEEKEDSPTIGNTLLAEVASGNVFKVADIKDLLNKVTSDEISFSKMVELLNSEIRKHYSGEPKRKVAKMDVVRFLEAYQYHFAMSEELKQSLAVTLYLIQKSIIADAEETLKATMWKG